MAHSATAADLKPWRDPAAEPFIKIRNITKKFGDFTAVDNVSLDIFKGELFCLLGGSGCGKSTLLRMMSGFEKPSSGTIEIDGQDMSNVSPYHRPTNMMFQSYALFPHMSVEKNIAYGLLREGMSKPEAMEKVAAMLRLVKLEKFARRKPHQLSGGQRQRVALARSLVKKPKLLLLDEPLGALDKKLREETQFELINIQETLGVTFIVVTHDQEEAMTLSTRIGVMNEGEIVQIGEPTQIYERPASRFVADFIGSVNMFEGKVDTAAPDAMRIITESVGPVLVKPIEGLTHGQSVSVALRPEKLTISRTELTGDTVLHGMVEDVAYMGNLSIFRVRLANGTLVRITRSSRLADQEPISWDQEIWAQWGVASGVVLTS